ncbi:P-loop containing nucleoside triphosphate hydrolase protein [Polychaeton citri CBS 116435]|uniref:P-loop containing nucleoside triphosphate hydrolase protein n=1 Tax=Polychaeton citri CBS 116435 TaxID=1314669 RepID=A0A9P4Q4B4_9PEZI|nr:P-loop containing nucleoside triphosphate hydrolase protein [Polychaeton citri CBS 116435]
MLRVFNSVARIDPLHEHVKFVVVTRAINRLPWTNRTKQGLARPAFFSHAIHYESAVDERRKAEITLRPYQEESIQAVLDHASKGERRLGLSLATGSGKTVIFSHLIDRMPSQDKVASQTLILAHRKELVEQAARHCRELYPHKTTEIEMGKHHASGLADITVASVQSIASQLRLSRYDPGRFKLVLVDEAHHVVSPTYLDILSHFGLRDRSPKACPVLVGVSATFSRADGLSLGAAIDHIVYHKDYIDMIEDDWLSKLVFTTVESGADLSRVRSRTGDFQPGSLSKAVNRQDVNTVTVRSWLAKATGRQSTLVFCVDLDHVASLTSEFRTHGIDARFVTSDTHPKTRSERLEAFKAGEFPVLLNCGIFTEGTDIPNIDCVLLARPTKSRNLLVQMIGRGLRKHVAKADCHVIDMVASLGTGIVTTPTLFGLDPQELIDAQESKQLKRLSERRQEEQAREANMVQQSPPTRADGNATLSGDIIFTDYEDIHELLDDTSGERHIRAISPNAWVQVDEGKYLLPNKNGNMLTIRREEERFNVVLTRKLQVAASVPYARPHSLAKAMTFEDAVHAADTYASEAIPSMLRLRTASWRRREATQAQLDMLNSHRPKDKQLKPGDVKMGQASDQITKLKHGAKTRYNKLAAGKRKADRVVENSQRFREEQRRQQVRVGPVGI